ncbi:unnamed protein product [Cunninghamella blakesleeana]
MKQTGVTKNTVGRFYDNIRYHIVKLINSELDQRVGGEGTTVEVDEVLFGRRKYNREGRFCLVTSTLLWIIKNILRIPETGAHTNSIEGFWTHLRGVLPSLKRGGKIEDYIAEYKFRKRNKGRLTDALIDALKI